MPALPPIDRTTQHALRGCVHDLRRASRGADALASQVGALLGSSATSADRRLAASLRTLAEETYRAASAIEIAAAQ